MKKTCIKCGRKKDVSLFYKCRAYKSGLDCYCKQCHALASKIYFQKKLKEDPGLWKKRYIKAGGKESKYACKRRGTLKGRVDGLLFDIRCRSKKRNLPFNLDKEWIFQKIKEQDNRCLLTRISFDTSRSKSYRGRNPYAPSIDRINSKKGYTKNNCRVVCLCVNLALSNFGIKVLKRWCAEFLGHQGARHAK